MRGLLDFAYYYYFKNWVGIFKIKRGTKEHPEQGVEITLP